MAERTVIATRDGYLRAVDRIAAGTGPVAVDTERASGFRYSQRAYLIQLFRRDAGTFLFDPPAIGRFDELETAIADEECILHAASQDLPCLREVGLDPGTIFDTELASRLLGLPRVALGTVVEELLGVHLEKAHSAADWSTRPLPQSWLDYAALDVELLVDLRDRLAALLEQDGKGEIARQEFRAELGQPPKPPRTDPWRRLSGIHAVKGGRRLAVARALWEARDAFAREVDTAPGRLVPDAALVAAAQALPASKQELAALKAFRGRASRTELDRWWSAIEGGLAADPPPARAPRNHDAPPPARSWGDKNPEAAARLAAARDALGAIAAERNLPVENLVTPEFVRRLAWSPPAERSAAAIDAELELSGARPWQREAVAGALAEAFADAEARVRAPAE